MSTLKVGGIRGVSASSDAITVANDGTCTANITSVNGGQLGNRNKVINGAMICSQRGTSFSPDNTEQPFTLDRFQHVATSGADGDCTVTQSTDAPSGFKNSYKVTPDATNTPTGSGNVTIRHKLEGQNLQDLAYGTSSAKSLTISFYAKTASANSGDQYALCLFYARQDNTQKTVSVAFTPTSTYQRFSFTFAGDTDASYGIKNDNGDGMHLVWVLAAGPDDIKAAMPTWTVDGGFFRGVTGQSNFMDNTSNEFYLTGVQLEVGSVATDFEHKSFGQELALCQRYYQVLATGDQACIGNGFAFQTNRFQTNVHLPVEMRTTPSLDEQMTGGTKYRINLGNSDQNTGITPSLSSVVSNTRLLNLGWSSLGSNVTNGDGGQVRKQGDSGILGVSAEL